MNERIKQLAEQAGFETDRGPLLDPGPYIRVGGGLCVGVPLEKFAELLVKECAKKVAPYAYRGLRGIDHEDWEIPHGWAGDCIRAHFGVKE